MPHFFCMVKTVLKGSKVNPILLCAPSQKVKGSILWKDSPQVLLVKDRRSSAKPDLRIGGWIGLVTFWRSWLVSQASPSYEKIERLDCETRSWPGVGEGGGKMWPLLISILVWIMIAYCSGHMVKIVTLRNRFFCNLGATLQAPPDQEKVS